MDSVEELLWEYDRLYREKQGEIDAFSGCVQKQVEVFASEEQLSSTQCESIAQYVDDRVTLFRYLKMNDFSMDESLSAYMDTVRWRIRECVDSICWADVDPAFWQEPFFHFHKFDRWGRPVGVIRLKHLPDLVSSSAGEAESDADLPTPTERDGILHQADRTPTEKMRKFLILILEMGRKMSWDITRAREAKKLASKKLRRSRTISYRETPVLCLHALLLVDLKDASLLSPTSMALKDFPPIMQEFFKLRYPSSIGGICVLNFGWIWQSVWQISKSLLSEKARSRISFPSLGKMKDIIEPTDLLAGQCLLVKSEVQTQNTDIVVNTDMGGEDDYEWSFESDAILQSYGRPGEGFHPLAQNGSADESRTSTNPTVSLSLPPLSPLNHNKEQKDSQSMAERHSDGSLIAEHIPHIDSDDDMSDSGKSDVFTDAPSELYTTPPMGTSERSRSLSTLSTSASAASHLSTPFYTPFATPQIPSSPVMGANEIARIPPHLSVQPPAPPTGLTNLSSQSAVLAVSRSFERLTSLASPLTSEFPSVTASTVSGGVQKVGKIMWEGLVVSGHVGKAFERRLLETIGVGQTQGVEPNALAEHLASLQVVPSPGRDQIESTSSAKSADEKSDSAELSLYQSYKKTQSMNLAQLMTHNHIVASRRDSFLSPTLPRNSHNVTFLRTLSTANQVMKRTIGSILRYSSRFNTVFYWCILWLIVRGGVFEELWRWILETVMKINYVGLQGLGTRAFGGHIGSGSTLRMGH